MRAHLCVAKRKTWKNNDLLFLLCQTPGFPHSSQKNSTNLLYSGSLVRRRRGFSPQSIWNALSGIIGEALKGLLAQIDLLSSLTWNFYSHCLWWPEQMHWCRAETRAEVDPKQMDRAGTWRGWGQNQPGVLEGSLVCQAESRAKGLDSAKQMESRRCRKGSHRAFLRASDYLKS